MHVMHVMHVHARDAPAYNAFVSSTEHKAMAPARVRVFVLTVSDTRTDDTDTAGRAICELLEGRAAIASPARRSRRTNPRASRSWCGSRR